MWRVNIVTPPQIWGAAGSRTSQAFGGVAPVADFKPPQKWGHSNHAITATMEVLNPKSGCWVDADRVCWGAYQVITLPWHSAYGLNLTPTEAYCSQGWTYSCRSGP